MEFTISSGELSYFTLLKNTLKLHEKKESENNKVCINQTLAEMDNNLNDI